MPFTFDDPKTVDIARLVHELSRDLRLIKQLRAPTIHDFVHAPVLDDWVLTQRLEPALSGFVHGHPLKGDTNILTSGLYFLDPEAGYARTLSRFYRLGRRRSPT